MFLNNMHVHINVVIYILFQINEKHCVDAGMLLL